MKRIMKEVDAKHLLFYVVMGLRGSLAWVEIDVLFCCDSGKGGLA